MHLNAIARSMGLVLITQFMCPAVHAELPVEQLTVEALPATPNAHWIWVNDFAFFAMADGRAYLMNGDSGKVLGMLSTGYAFGGVVAAKNGTIYSPEIYFSRGTRGTRTDVVAIYELGKLNPVDEIAIPSKRAAILPMINATALTDDEQFLLIYNFTPAQSVTVVDTKRRKFLGELETAGCALVYPTGPRSFFSLCPDGKALTTTLDDTGKLKNTVRSAQLFDPKSDPVAEKGVRVGDTWYFVSFEGQVYTLKANIQGVQLADKWWLATAGERKQKWRSGGLQPLAVHRASNRLYAIMHQGGPHTHKDPGKVVWVYDLTTKKHIQTIELKDDATSIQITQDNKPLLFTAFLESSEVGVYDAMSGNLQRIVPSMGLTPTTLVNP